MDRRIHKTREAIIEAFVGLMAEKHFDQITISLGSVARYATE